MNLSAVLTYIAALSVATERLTEFAKRIPGVSSILSKRGTKPLTPREEDLRVMAVHLLSTVIAMVICKCFASDLPQVGQGTAPEATWSLCLGYGLLASGGSSFWNSALDTFRGVKQKMGQ